MVGVGWRWVSYTHLLICTQRKGIAVLLLHVILAVASELPAPKTALARQAEVLSYGKHAVTITRANLHLSMNVELTDRRLCR